MRVMQELVAYFDHRGRLSRKQMHKLLDQGYLASDAPPTMVDLCDRVGAVYYFRVTGDVNGQVWGTDVYTGDSALTTAAVHAGLVKPGAAAILRVTVEQPLKQYPGSTRHGVTSHDFGPFGTAYRVSAV